MSDLAIECPKCGERIALTESLAGPLLAEAKINFSRQLRQAEALAIERARKELAEEGQSKADRLAEELEVEKRGRASLLEKVAVAQKAQAEAVRKEMELAEREAGLELAVEKKVAAQVELIRSRAASAAQEEIGMRLAEKEKVIGDMQAQILEMKRKAEQGSQQLQGEVQELMLERELSAKFPADSIEPVAKGVAGGDCLQVVMAGTQRCGSILWESKRTKAWSDAWLPKLREDQRNARADLAVIVSQVPPKGMGGAFDVVDGVWVVRPELSVALALALRDGLLRAAEVARAQEGSETKAGLVYSYLTGQAFRGRVMAIVEAFRAMQEDLEAEKRAITRQWAKREDQIARVMRGTAGMYGDLQGMIGKTLQEINDMSLKALEEK